MTAIDHFDLEMMTSICMPGTAYGFEHKYLECSADTDT